MISGWDPVGISAAGSDDIHGNLRRIEHATDEGTQQNVLLEQSVRIDITGPSSIMRARDFRATEALAGRDNVAFTFRLEDGKSGLATLKSGESQLAVLEREEVDELDSKLLEPSRYVLVATWLKEAAGEGNIISTERIVDFNEDDARHVQVPAQSRPARRRPKGAPPGQQHRRPGFTRGGRAGRPRSPTSRGR